ncbi:MAG: GNAT family N-acetyltransferase [Christensenellales bacterium]
MDKLFDNDTHLMWEKYDKYHPSAFRKNNKILDSWSSAPNVQEYISNEQPVSSLFLDFFDDGCNIYYCFDKKILAGAVLISEPYFKDDNSTIEYIVVNPELQGRGIGTRMIKSITSNPQFFVGDKYNGKFVASVSETNLASQKAFLKNNFQVLQKPKSKIITKYLRFFFSERNMQK